MTKGQKIEALKALQDVLADSITLGMLDEALEQNGVTHEEECRNMEDWLTQKVQELIEQEMSSDG
jgi:hypothetical protein